MAAHQVGGSTILVEASDQNFFFARRQGVTITIDPTRRWWCLFLCKTAGREVRELNCSIQLSGLVQTTNAQDSCTRCGSLRVMGPFFFGFNVPRAFTRVAYEGSAAGLGSFSGVESFS